MSKKVLILEDTKELQWMMQELLEEAGLLYTMTENGEEGVEALKQGKYDLIISDLKMPRMDGLEFTRAARKLGVTVPIFLYTSTPFNIEAEAAEAGCTGVIEKGCQEGIAWVRETLLHLKID